MIKKYIEKYLDKTVDTAVEEGKKTLKQVRIAFILAGIGILVFLTGIIGILIYIVSRLF